MLTTCAVLRTETPSVLLDYWGPRSFQPQPLSARALSDVIAPASYNRRRRLDAFDFGELQKPSGKKIMTIIITVKAKESLHQRMDTLKPMSVTDHAPALSRKSIFLFYV